MRVNVTLACTECGDRNYITTKNKRNNPERVEMKKFCSRENKTNFTPWNKIIIKIKFKLTIKKVKSQNKRFHLFNYAHVWNDKRFSIEIINFRIVA